MISCQDIQTYMDKISAEILQIEEKDIDERINNYLRWLKESYDEMDDEAKQYVDKAFDGLAELIKSTIEDMPDCLEKRKLWRYYLSGEGRYQSAEDLLRRLEEKPRDIQKNTYILEDMILAGIQDAISFLSDISEGTRKGLPKITCLSLFYACIDEIIAALHLARHHYYIQANAHLRTVLETLDKIKLFISEPHHIDIWTGEDYKQKNKELSPSAVRVKLGLEPYDEFYSYLSEHGTHPTYQSFKSRTVIKKSTKPKKTIKVIFGGIPFEHLKIFFYSSTIRIVSKLVLEVIRFDTSNLNNEEIELALDRQKNVEFEFNKNYFIKWVKDNEMDSSEIEEILKALDESWNDA